MQPPLPGTSVRFTGGKFNGFTGVVAKVCDTVCSVVITFEHRPYEVVDEHRHVTPLAEWTAARSTTELKLRGADPHT